MGAKGGTTGENQSGGIGGQASVGVGTTKYNGGNAGGDAAPFSGTHGTGGGGAAGQYSAGNNAANGSTGTTGDAGASGDAGYGGAGGSTSGGNGGNGTEWDASHGSGGGGGGADTGSSTVGNGGLYGGGAGGQSSSGVGGTGGQGLIVITYTEILPTQTPTNTPTVTPTKSMDSPGLPSAGSGMHTLQQIYDYLNSGIKTTPVPSFQEPGAGPGATMKTLEEIYEDIQAKYDQCDATISDVNTDVKFFCTQSGSWGVQTGTASGGGLLKTGQTSIYQTGDNGSHQTGINFQYTNTDAGLTVTDNVTGLIWPKSGNGAGCNSGNELGWSSAIVWAEGLSFAGYSDWRLPNITELQTIFVRETGQGAPYINKSYFLVTRSEGYWSSTTYTNNPTYAMYAHFNDGLLYGNVKTSSYYVRAVRGGE
ncbi:MAG: DUF1566 domain-containing protein [Candidatus Aureabacteria bacterium]|nr:DUF1566 domain-containing protein [Candidatus Auribacterota bacterium]